MTAARENKIYYVYIDRTIDLNRVFYVGKGQLARVRSKNRNDHWKSIVNKHGWALDNREVVLATKDHKYALEIEMYYVLLYKTFESAWQDGSGWGANHTAGGDGTIGYISAMRGKKQSEETKRKMSESKIGEKHPFFGKSQPESTKQKWGDGRRAGENNTAVQLKEFQVLEIIQKYISGNYTQEKLGKEYGVSRGCVKHILSGKTWAKLIDDEMVRSIKKQSKRSLRQSDLTFMDAQDMRYKYEFENYTYSKLMKEYNISKSSVSSIINNKTYKKE